MIALLPYQPRRGCTSTPKDPTVWGKIVLPKHGLKEVMYPSNIIHHNASRGSGDT